MSNRAAQIDSFDLSPGRRLAGKYIVGKRLGVGWEGEVYYVTEEKTGGERAAKLFFPVRNPGDKAVTFYARKLEALRDCSMVIRYHTQEQARIHGVPVTALISEYVAGELMDAYVARQPGKRLHPFEALHLLHTIARGVEEIHEQGEYHGDLHAQNILLRRVGIQHRVKIVDFYHWGRCTAEHRRDDLYGLIRLFYDSLGGQKHYASHAPEIKYICAGLKRSLISKRFKSVTHLRRHLETMAWE